MTGIGTFFAFRLTIWILLKIMSEITGTLLVESIELIGVWTGIAGICGQIEKISLFAVVA